MTSISVLIPWWYGEEISVFKVLFFFIFWLIMEVSLSYVISNKGNQNRKTKAENLSPRVKKLREVLKTETDFDYKTTLTEELSKQKGI